MRKLFRFLLGLTACGVLAFATYNLVAYVQESNQSTNLNESLIDKAVAVKDPAPQSSNLDSITEQESESDTEQLPMETAPIGKPMRMWLGGFTVKIRLSISQ